MSSNSQFIDPSDTVIDGSTGEIIPSNYDTSQIALLSKAEIDQQISTAKAYPRSEDKSLKKAESLACRDEETAGSMFYSIPRGGKHIQGPSVRLAEIFASTWGNLRVQTRIVDANDRFVTTQAVAHDLETNTAVLVEKRRRVLAKKGRAADDDAIQIAGLAGQSIVFRDAIFRVIPRVYIDQVTRKAQLTSVGKAESIVKMREKMVTHFSKMGVGVERVLEAVGARGIEDIDMDDLITLRGMATAIRDGASKIEDCFPEPDKKPTDGNAAAAEALKQKAQGNGKPAEEKSPTPVAEKTETPAQEAPVAEKPPVAADPQWVIDWKTRIAALPRFTPAASTFDELLKSYRDAAEENKPLYFELFTIWTDKTIPFADKPSLLPLLKQKIDGLEKFVPADLLSQLRNKVLGK